MTLTATILIVDDNVETLRMMQLVLRRLGYRVLLARDGYQALTIAKRDLPDLVLLDVMMPDIDGLEVTRRLRADPATADMLIVMFSAKSGLEYELEGYKAGADDYLTKTATPGELAARVNKALSRARKAPRGRSIGVLAAKGGVGVSTVALNLGVITRQQTQEEIIVADFRPGQGTIGLVLGYEHPPGLNRLLTLESSVITPREVEQVLMRHGSGTRLLLSSHQPRDAKHIAAVPAAEAVARTLPQLARYSFLDLGSGLTPMSSHLIGACDLLLVVVEPVPSTVVHSRALHKDLLEIGVMPDRVLFILVNRGGSSLQMSRLQVEEELGCVLAGVITPAAELAYQAAMRSVPMITMQPEGITTELYTKLSATVIDQLN